MDITKMRHQLDRSYEHEDRIVTVEISPQVADIIRSFQRLGEMINRTRSLQSTDHTNGLRS